MTLMNNRKIVNLMILIVLLFAGWAVYTKRPLMIVVCLAVAGLLAVFEESMIRWF